MLGLEDQPLGLKEQILGLKEQIPGICPPHTYTHRANFITVGDDIMPKQQALLSMLGSVSTGFGAFKDN